MSSESNNTGKWNSMDSVCGNHASHIDDVYVFGGIPHLDDDNEVYEFENVRAAVPEAGPLHQKDESPTNTRNPFIEQATDSQGNSLHSATQRGMKSREPSASLGSWLFRFGLPSFAAVCFVCFIVLVKSRQSTNTITPPVKDRVPEPPRESTFHPTENQPVVSADVDDQSEVVALYRTGNEHYEARRYHEAIRSYEAALKLAPNNAIACNNLALVLATCPNPSYRHGTRARALSELACNLTNNNEWKFLSIRAAAEAECGDFINAIKYAKLAESKAPLERRIDVERMLEQLQSQQPYRWP